MQTSSCCTQALRGAANGQMLQQVQLQLDLQLLPLSNMTRNTATSLLFVR